jgi:hypothetical protein
VLLGDLGALGAGRGADQQRSLARVGDLDQVAG